MRRKRKERLSRKQRRIKNRITLRTLFLLSLTFIFNTYAWFMYANYVTADLTASVDAWHVEFEVDDELIQREFAFQVAHAYPGMDTVTKQLSVSNSGDKQAELLYDIKMARIFDDVYVSQEAIADGYTAPVGAVVLTEAQLLSKVQNDFPFHLTFTRTNQIIQVNGTSSLTISFSWAYDNGDDETDTLYGTEAYTFNSANTGVPSIEVIIVITATQHND